MATELKAKPFLVDDDEPDELDRKIDAVLGRIGAVLRTLIILGLLGAFAYYILWPNLESWGPYILYAAYLLFQLFFAIMFMIVQFVALFWFLGRPRMYWVMPGETGVGFKDYKGNPEVLESARRIVTLLRGVKKFKAMGGQPTRGLLLVGPPGTGKSYLGQVISSEAGVPFGYLSAPSIQGMFWGMDVLRVWSLYRKARGLARKYGACILFIDEIDAIGRARAAQGPGFGMGGLMFGAGAAALNQLLNEMEPLPREEGWLQRLLRNLGLRRGKAEVPPVLTMAATNLAEVLDPALLRPGRFDRKIVVDLPSAEGRREIIEYYLEKVQHEPMPIDLMVFDTIGYTPVAIKHVINEAVIVAHFDGRDKINYRDFTRAREIHEWGLRQPIRSMSKEEKRRIAYHEAGHAVAMVKLYKRERLVKVTIIRHGQALGLAAPKPTEEKHTITKEEILADIQVSLASRAAEQLFLGTEMTGAAHDLENATRWAAYYTGYFGMNGTLISAAAFPGVQPDGHMREQIERLLEQEFKKVKKLIQENADFVTAVAEALLEREELTGDEVLEIMREVESRRPVLATNGHVAEPFFGLPGTARRTKAPALTAGDGADGIAANGAERESEPVRSEAPQREADGPPPA